MTMRRMGVLLLLGLQLGVLSVGTGCVSAPWVIVRQAVPNVLAGQTQYQLQPLRFDALRVGEKTQAEYLAGKDPAQRSSWQADLLAMNQVFTERLYVSAPGFRFMPQSPGKPAGPFTIVPHIVFIEPGFYALVAAAPSQVRMTLQIHAAGGLVDEIQVEVAIEADMGNASSGQRLREAAARLGEISARYLRERAGV